MNLFLAKTKDEKTIVEHTNDLLYYYDAFKEEFESIIDPQVIELIELAVIYHDIGKVNRRFQNKLYEKLDKPLLPILEKNDEIPHGYLSPAFIDFEALKEKYSDALIEILVTSIMLHHTRQQIDTPMKREIKRLVIEELNEDINDFSYEKLNYFSRTPSSKYLRKKDKVLNQSIFIDEKLNPKVKGFIMVKGTLNKLDYLASAMDRESTYNYPLGDKTTGLTVDHIVIDKIKNDGFELRPIQTALYANKDKSGIVIASTGMGKTEAALLWLSDQKGIFTLPLKVSIDAIYKRVKQTYHYKAVELVHSSMEDIYLQEQDAILNHSNRINEARLFTSPLTITTIDQVFKCGFLHNGCELMLSTLMNAKVVIDEIQMYDSQLIACLIHGLKLIHHLGGKFLIMTATLPEYIIQLIKEQGIPFEGLFTETFLLEDDKCSNRHLLEITGSQLAIDKIIDQGKKHKVLVIVNTVKRAQEVYRELSNILPVRLLHSNFIRKDRRCLEDRIQNFTNNENQLSEKGIWISTQIVEASLDIDFDILHTEMCSIDSFIQRMGRVYRRRYVLESDEANVYVADTRNTGYGKVIDIDMYETSLKVLNNYNGQWITEKDKQQMMAEVFDEKLYPNMKKFKEKVHEKINYFKNLGLHQVDKKAIESMFRDIDSKTCIPFNRYQSLVQSGMLEQIENNYLGAKTSVEKSKAKNSLLDYTLSVRSSSRDWREAEEEILKRFNIHICDRVYDFNEDEETGEGLTLELESDDVFL